ncbi:ATP-dependent DNA helicase PIF1-like protein, partial [Tanacetum coccineum]
EVATLITNDFGDGLPSRDIVVDSKDGGLKRISELHLSYMALQYSLLFPYGEDGFHEKIPYHTNRGTRKTKRGYVSMKEYYAYVIQLRKCQGNTLIRGGRLYQQYLVDAYTAVEEQRLQWTRNNQDTLWVDLYHNLNDAFTRGDTNAEGLGKRINLPRTFTGGPRYIMQNYQDAMALCRAYKNLDLFITFTSNPKWPKIGEMLAFIRGQKPYDRPEAHINVEWCNRSKAIKYLFKYLNKGPDHATFVIQENVQKPAHGEPEKVAAVDEIKNYSNCRYLAPCEVVWRLFSFDVHYSYPSVMKLNFHLKDQQATTLHYSQNLPALLNRKEIKITMFTE